MKNYKEISIEGGNILVKTARTIVRNPHHPLGTQHGKTPVVPVRHRSGGHPHKRLYPTPL